MATVTLNSLTVSLRGRIGNLVFYPRYNKLCVRTYVVPKNPDTVMQRKCRRAFADAIASWQAMSSEERYAWERKARYVEMSGYNLFISGFMTGKKTLRKKRNVMYSCKSLQVNEPYLSRIHSVSLPLLPPDCITTTNIYPAYGCG